ncbi:MAG: hypothetical protein NTX61_13240 [Bacteroidetes bacterium]|nr:hypothetical protein [Bacteroidota bacterium]
MTERQRARNSEKYATCNFNIKSGQNVRVVFYNVENLYDPYNDSVKRDDDFTSTGGKRWTYSRFLAKLLHLSKLFISIGEGNPPAIIGMCEVENDYVLQKLIYATPLKNTRYKIIHYDSPDARGVDVAMLYRPDRFRVLASKPVKVRFPFDTNSATRDILYVRGLIFTQDTLHLFINHWPSRRGGYTESTPKRNFVAGLLKFTVDSILQKHTNANILIMGDFNDEPDNESISRILGARADTGDLRPMDLVNLMTFKLKEWNMGTIKYQGKWSIFDQIIISGNLLGKQNSIHSGINDAHIFKGNFLLEDDSRYLGSKLNRTYVGPNYHGGFSDHLPIYLDIWSE